MDEYKEHFYTRDPAISKLDFGDVSAQKEIRNRLQCKPFSWFMSEVAYDMLEKFPIPPKNKVWGEVGFIRRYKQAFFYKTINFEY